MDTIRFLRGEPGHQQPVLLVLAAIESVDFAKRSAHTISGVDHDLSNDAKAWQELLDHFLVDPHGNPPESPEPWAARA